MLNQSNHSSEVAHQQAALRRVVGDTEAAPTDGPAAAAPAAPKPASKPASMATGVHSTPSPSAPCPSSGSAYAAAVSAPRCATAAEGAAFKGKRLTAAARVAERPLQPMLAPGMADHELLMGCLQVSLLSGAKMLTHLPVQPSLELIRKFLNLAVREGLAGRMRQFLRVGGVYPCVCVP